MKRRISVLIPCFLLLSIFIGCSNKKEYNYEFVNIRWTRVTEADTEYIIFSSNGEFSYYCACGNPVNDSDLCAGYSYNAKTKILTLNYSEATAEAVTKITFVKCTNNELILDFDGDIRTFEVDNDTEFLEKIAYKDKEYALIEFPGNVFCYDLAADIEYDEDVIYEIRHDKWDVIYYNGDLFALSADLLVLNAYYSDNDNCDWSIIIEKSDDDIIVEKELSPSADEIEFFDNADDLPRSETILFENIEIFGTLVKTSKDGLIAAKVDLLHLNDCWYWRTSTIDDSVEGWPEYIVMLPESLDEKINAES